MKSRIKFWIPLIACLALLAGTTPARAEEEIKIGIIAALSGGGTAWGQGLEHGVSVAIDEVNAKGGLVVKGKTYKLRSIAYDDQYNAAQAKTAVDRLVNDDKIHFLFGPMGSPGALATVPVAEPAKVLQFVDGYAPAILKNEYSKDSYIFRIGLSAKEFSGPVIKWIKKTMPNAKKIAVIAPNDAVGQAAIVPLIDTYKAEGFEVWTDYYERGSKEFTPQLTRMVAQNVDVFDLDSNAPGEGGLLIKQAREVGFRGKIVQAGGAGVTEVVNIAGKRAEGFLKYDPVNMDAPELKPFVKAYEKKYSGVINSLAPMYYSAAQILFEAIRRTNSLDTTVLRNEIEKMDGFDTKLFGTLKWTGKETYGANHQIVIPFYMLEVQNGKGVSIAKVNP